MLGLGLLALLLASQLPHLVRGVVIVSAETKPVPLPRPTLALLGLAAPLSMHDSAELTAKALPVSRLCTVQDGAHDIPFSQPGVIASELHRQIRSAA